MGEIDHAQDRVDDGEPEGQQGIGAAQAEGVDGLLDEIAHAPAPEPARRRDRHGRPAREARSSAAPDHEDDAIGHHIGAVGDVEGRGHVLLDQQDGLAALLQPQDQLEDAVDHLGRQAERGLVEQHQPGLGHQRAGDGELLLLPARERARGLVAPLGQDGKQLEDLGPVAGQGRRIAPLPKHRGSDSPAPSRKGRRGAPPAPW